MTGRGRFAPSPTSDLHLGNLRTALLAWAFARQAGLGHLVRVEDLDQQRVASAPQVAERQLLDLADLGVLGDEPVVWQSRRLAVYEDALARLDTYECFCTRRDIAEASQAPHDGFRPYPGTCAHLTESERERRRAERPAALRVRAAGTRWIVHDHFAGEVTGEVDDFVVRRNDGTPAYNLAVVVDDGLQGVSQVTRGRDLLESAPRQAWLADRLGFPQPEYVHVGLAVNPAGQRLAKRDGAVTLAELGDTRDEQLRTALALIGQSLGVPGLSRAEQLLDVDLAAAREDWVVQPALAAKSTSTT